MPVTTSRPGDVGLSAERLSHISEWMRLQVAARRTAGMSVLVARRGEAAFFDVCGEADVARGKPMSEDTIFRIHSMTKPLTSVAMMTLCEEGCVQLDDPVGRFIPAFADSRVFVSGSRSGLVTVPAVRGITVRDLLLHISGLTYGEEATPVDALYRAQSIDFETEDSSLKEVIERASRIPLIAQPGRRWTYSISTDVLGYLIEVIAEEPFERYLKRRVIDPLGMVDTDFHVPEAKHARFAASYTPDGKGGIQLIDDPATSRYLKPRRVNSGGGGLVSTVGDYARFCRLMLGKGQLDGNRLLGPETVGLMTSNHLNGGIACMGDGIGFGLGFSVLIEPAKAQIVGSPGAYGWAGAASTAFWVDPAEDLYAVLMTQLSPWSSFPFSRELKALTYQAIVD